MRKSALIVVILLFVMACQQEDGIIHYHSAAGLAECGPIIKGKFFCIENAPVCDGSSADEQQDENCDNAVNHMVYCNGVTWVTRLVCSMDACNDCTEFYSVNETQANLEKDNLDIVVE